MVIHTAISDDWRRDVESGGNDNHLSCKKVVRMPSLITNHPQRTMVREFCALDVVCVHTTLSNYQVRLSVLMSFSLSARLRNENHLSFANYPHYSTCHYQNLTISNGGYATLPGSLIGGDVIIPKHTRLL